MKKINLVASLAALLVVVYSTASIADSHSGANSGWYTELALGYSDPQSPNYIFKNGVEKVNLDTDYSARVTAGYDFGEVRGDLRVQYFQLGNPETIGSTTIREADIKFGSVMLNGSYDFQVHDMIVPFVSIGAGIAGGRGEGTIFSSTGTEDTFGKESTEVGNRVVVAPAIRAGLGVALNLNDNVGVVVDYDYLHIQANGSNKNVDDINIQTGSVGLRIRF